MIIWAFDQEPLQPRALAGVPSNGDLQSGHLPADPPEIVAESVLPEPTLGSIARAKEAQAIERRDFTRMTGAEVGEDGRIALLIGNAIAAACYGPRGEWR